MLKSPVTVAICILCTLVFVLEIAQGGNVFNCSAEILLNLGASTGLLTIVQGQYFRLISCIFLHAYLLHLILNVYLLIDFGQMAETSLGKRLYIFIFLFSGIMGALASIIYNPAQTSVGASAAVVGLLGALIYQSWFKKDGASFTRPQIVMLCVFLLYSLLLGFTSEYIDNAAHLSGFFSGMIVCAAFYGTKPGNAIELKRGIAASVLLIALIPTLIFFDKTRIERDPNVAVFKYRTEATPLMNSSDNAGALVKLNAAQSLCGNKVTEVLYARAIVFERLKKFDLALQDIDRWLSANQNDVHALTLKSTIQHNLGNNTGAIESATRTIEVKPTLLELAMHPIFGEQDKAMSYNNRAWYKLSAGQTKEALTDSDKALALAPRAAVSYDTRGMAFYMLKDYSQAERDFSRSIALNASDIKNKKGATADGGGYYHRAIARLALGDAKGAKEDLDRFHTLDYKPEPWEPKP
jgi:membrane associated rhomboid family serine protease